MRTIMKIAESLVVMNHWRVERLDIQHYTHLKGEICGFVGYLDIRVDDDVIERIIIHDDGSFELNRD